MASRYDGRLIFANSNIMYSHLLEERGLTKIVQYSTPFFRKLTPQQERRLTVVQRRWSTGDRLYKLAAHHYGDPRYWWVIARFNNKPTESHFKLGDMVYIPLPRETIFEYYGA